MNTILFDLDGTLLPMDQELFIRQYFKQLISHFIPKGFGPEELINGVNEGTKAMLGNDGNLKNEDRFWKVFSDNLEEDMRAYEQDFFEFYQTKFQNVKATTTSSEHAARCIKKLKDKNYFIVVATNPVFPPVATLSRIAWAGLNPEDFIHITTYDNSSYCKPNLEYYKEILEIIGKDPSECMMVGNDVTEDMCAKNLGMDTYLITDCLINTHDLPTDQFIKGSLEDFERFVDSLPAAN